MTESTREPAITQCPSCGTNIALLPAASYESSLSEAEIRSILPGDITGEAARIDARFAVMDKHGQYECPVCRMIKSFDA